ncbi:MAG: hypothetical protein KIT84_01810 [Labilithrix sp.]|nr:hypothetical protein [Labilithrix sp.]MCW5809723.1 hypothetical protein [Labilithrix sp.]
MKLSLAVVALGLALAACAGSSSDADNAGVSVGEVNADAEITMANWISHPKIVEVRRIVEEIDVASFATVTKELCEGSTHGELERTKLTDAHGVVRELVIGSGSEDSAQTDSYYYDAAGTLRFAFLTHADVHGNQSELRVYNDAAGHRIWEVSRAIWIGDEDPTTEITNAPFEPTSDTVVLDALATTPAAWFDAPERCD